MFATKRQVAYLNHLSDRAEFIKMRHPSLIPQGLMRETYQFGMLSSEKAGLQNKTTPQHDNIISLMNKNMGKIRKLSMAS